MCVGGVVCVWVLKTVYWRGEVWSGERRGWALRCVMWGAALSRCVCVGNWLVKSRKVVRRGGGSCRVTRGGEEGPWELLMGVLGNASPGRLRDVLCGCT
jgi:hypothetical protein